MGNARSGSAFANLILVVKGVKCNAVLLIKQVCLLCPDHLNCSPLVVTSEHFWIEALFHHCKSLYKLPQHAYPYPKKTKILEHAVRNICFNCIIRWIVKTDREQETPSLQMPSYCRSMNTKKSSQKFIPGTVCSLPHAMHKRIKSWEKSYRRETSSAITRDRGGHHSSRLIPSLGCCRFLHIPVHRPADQVVKKKHCQEQCWK